MHDIMEQLTQFGLKLSGPSDPRLGYVVSSVANKTNNVVLANRGGGKTVLTAAAAVIQADTPNFYSTIIGGSETQSQRVAENCRRFAGDTLDDKKSTQSRLVFQNGARIEVLSQSQKAVRGVHADKIRVDELDLFDPAIWEALNYSTTGKHGTIDVTSTAHLRLGIMQKLVDAVCNGTWPAKLHKWNLFDCIGCLGDCIHCPFELSCPQTGGNQPRHGHISVLEAYDLSRRVSAESWDAEMLCLRPARADRVFSGFSPAHIKNPSRTEMEYGRFGGGVDFGFVNPFAFVQLLHVGETFFVTGEHQASYRSVAAHASLLRAKFPQTVYVGVDPAGAAIDSTSADSPANVLRRFGFIPSWRGMTVQDGLEAIRSLLSPARGTPRLFISPECTQTIAAIQDYHYGDSTSEMPAKDGPDHLMDALRYGLCMMDFGTAWRRY